MLRRPIVAVVLCTLAGCQDYNFNPVGKCIIQPGSQRILISSVSTADVLFVVDDSGSMDPMQANLSRNFDAFITSLAQAQADRKSQQLDPFEFHIAITTSSIFQNFKGGQACSGGICSIGGNSVHGDYQYACANAGDLCGDYMTVFSGIPDPTCTLGTAAGNNTPYPQGDFVALGANPKVLHFTKDLKWETWGTTSVDAQLQQRVDQFKQNVLVGSCGSGQEQHFEAGRLAVKKALQTNGLKQPADVAAADWPHPGAKMVVVWLGNEDDCSNPPTVTAPGATLVPASLVVDGSPGADTCLTAEASTPATDTPGKLFPLDDYVSYFTGLGRPFGAAFIYSAVPDATSVGGFKGGTCGATPGACILPSPGVLGTCIGDSAGTRFQQLAAGFRSKGISTVEGTVCDAEFAKTLQSIANLVVPVNALSLPTQPAESDVAVLRIEAADGTTRKFCTGPGPTLDWNFVSCDGKATPAAPGTTTACMSINHATKNCEANPGETYVAQYLGLVPQPSGTSPGGCLAANDCTAALGGADKDWTCIIKAAGSRGTCACQAN
jgi:hypothetical protein